MENNTDMANTSPKQALHVLYHSSNMYAIPTGVSIYSLLKNNTDIDEIHLHVINDDIAEENVLKIERIATQFGRRIEWIDGKALADDMARCHLPKFRDTYTSYMKIFAPNIILIAYPSAKNLLYIDSDTVVVGSLRDIPDMDLCENVLAGVYEIQTSNERKRLGISTNYVNGGIMLFNLHNWHKNGCEETIKKTIGDINFAKKIIYAEQDIFNILYSPLIQRLPIRYNVISRQVFLRPASKYIRRFHNPDGYYSDEEVEAAIENPTILHYIDFWTGRPWDEPNVNPFSEVYYQYKNAIMPDETVIGIKVKQSKFRKTIKRVVIWLMHHVSFKKVGELISVILIYAYDLPTLKVSDDIDTKL